MAGRGAGGCWRSRDPGAIPAQPGIPGNPIHPCPLGVIPCVLSLWQENQQSNSCCYLLLRDLFHHILVISQYFMDYSPHSRMPYIPEILGLGGVIPVNINYLNF